MKLAAASLVRRSVIRAAPLAPVATRVLASRSPETLLEGSMRICASELLLFTEVMMRLVRAALVVETVVC